MAVVFVRLGLPDWEEAGVVCGDGDGLEGDRTLLKEHTLLCSPVPPIRNTILHKPTTLPCNIYLVNLEQR